MGETLSITSERPTENEAVYPSLLKRFIASFIDSSITFVFIGLMIMVTDRIDDDSAALKIIALLLCMSYEPLMIRFSRTFGQMTVGIKVKSVNEREKAPLLKSYLRYTVKSMLGWISYITIHSNGEMRSIHDIITDTVVIDVV